MNRRQVLQTGAASAALAASTLLQAPRVHAASEKKPRRVGLIGAGWYGKCDLFRLLQVEPVEVVAICDVDSRMLADALDKVAAKQKSGKQPRGYGDYRQMLAEHEFDIVINNTPDHWHCLPTIAAIEAGADVWVQKPISVDVAEGQAMLAAARKHSRVVQVGTQRRSTPHLIEARDRIIREGKLGKIAHVEVYCYYHMRAKKSPPDTAPPEYLDYEMWTGPAPLRPYSDLTHPRSWRAFMEYGNGIMGDMCIHMLDMVRWMLDLGAPRRISSSGGILVSDLGKSNIADTQSAIFDFGDLTCTWQHRSWGNPPDPDYPWAATIYGDRGTLKASVTQYDFIPRGGGEPIHGDVVYELDEYPEDKTEERLEKHVAPAIRRHWLDFLKAIDARSKPVADIEQGHISTASCLLANLSMELGRTLEWDYASGAIVGDPEANARLMRPYREPWVHPGVES